MRASSGSRFDSRRSSSRSPPAASGTPRARTAPIDDGERGGHTRHHCAAVEAACPPNAFQRRAYCNRGPSEADEGAIEAYDPIVGGAREEKTDTWNVILGALSETLERLERLERAPESLTL